MHNTREVKKVREPVIGFKLHSSAAGERLCVSKGVNLPKCLQQEMTPKR